MTYLHVVNRSIINYFYRAYREYSTVKPEKIWSNIFKWQSMSSSLLFKDVTASININLKLTFIKLMIDHDDDEIQTHV